MKYQMIMRTFHLFLSPALSCVFALFFLACGFEAYPQEDENGSGDGQNRTTSLSLVSDNLQLSLSLEGETEPLVGHNDYSLRAESEGQEPAPISDLTLTPWMPDHGHGSDREPAIIYQDQGHYTIEDVSFTMPGLWELRCAFSLSGTEDTAVFELDVQ